MRYILILSILLALPAAAQEKSAGEGLLDAFRQSCVNYVDDPRAFDGAAQGHGWQVNRIETEDGAVRMVRLGLPEWRADGIQLVAVTGISDMHEGGRIESCTFQVIGERAGAVASDVLPVLDARINEVLGEAVVRRGGRIGEGTLARYDTPGFPPDRSIRAMRERRALILTYTRLFPEAR